MKIINRFFFVLLTAFLLCVIVSANVRLPKLISDGMVLQRDAEVKIWGWADASEKITVSFPDSVYFTTADHAGNWEITLAGLKAGGPHTMVITGNNMLTIKNILVGDVWICSGQSNMELNMQRVSPLYKDEIAQSANNFIRYFSVPKKYNFKVPQEDLDYGQWETTNPETIRSFAAVPYFFAKSLYEKYGIPIGLINASLGGSPIEAWMSEESLKSFPHYYKELQVFKNDSLIKQIQKSDNDRIQAWYKLLRESDEGYKDPDHSWYDPDLSTADWPSMELPGYWANTSLGPVNGVVWFRREFDIPDQLAGKEAKLLVGRIVDADSVFVNGTFVGTTSYQYPPRRYTIPSGILKAGSNSIVVRVISNMGKGGFVPDKPYEIIIGENKVDLTGLWQYKLGTEMEQLDSQTFIQWKPAGLYNAMISPLLNYRMKGVIWYQGESNIDRYAEYKELFITLINEWRKKWNQGKFPFLFVQLPNYGEAAKQPGRSNWANFREAQMQALELPNTGMTVAVDIGEWNDIHSLNKKDVGKRLSLAAQKMAYREDQIVYSGPVYQSMRIGEDKIIITFEHVGGGLVVCGGETLNQFSIAGNDQLFVWAKARIQDDKVIVWSEQVKKPVAVRYAWADNPEGANLCNKEGLPASPFRTDNWTKEK